MDTIQYICRSQSPNVSFPSYLQAPDVNILTYLIIMIRIKSCKAQTVDDTILIDFRRCLYLSIMTSAQGIRKMSVTVFILGFIVCFVCVDLC